MHNDFSRSFCGRAIYSALAVLILVLILPLAGNAQVVLNEDDNPDVDAGTKAEIIDSVAVALNEIYVFPDVAEKMEKYLRKRLKDKEYDNILKLTEFADTLTYDLREISKDLHLAVRVAPPEAMELLEPDSLTDELRQQMFSKLSYNNFGFYKVERLEGNVGYLDLRGFNEAYYGSETAVAAMNFLAHTDALIIDLRQNGGGSPSMIQLISSYFFDEPVHLNSFYIRKEDSIKQFWTSAHVQGKRMTDVDLYVLTSSRTFSAAEEFTYNLKNLKRATIIGETTGGGAHPVERHIFRNLGVGIQVPFGRAINPISGTNWEGVGVKPDIEIAEAKALDVAYKEALKKLSAKVEDESRKADLDWVIASLDSKLNPTTVDENILKSYVGVYGPRTIIFEDGELYYQREERPKYKMIPMADDLFRFDEIEYFRLKVITDESGNPTELNGIYQGGYTDRSVKSSGT